MPSKRILLKMNIIILVLFFLFKKKKCSLKAYIIYQFIFFLLFFRFFMTIDTDTRCCCRVGWIYSCLIVFWISFFIWALQCMVLFEFIEFKQDKVKVFDESYPVKCVSSLNLSLFGIYAYVEVKPIGCKPA